MSLLRLSDRLNSIFDLDKLLDVLVEQALDGLGPVGWLVMRSHECAVVGEEGPGLIVVAGVERGDKVLTKVADQGRHVQKRTRIR